MTSTTASISDAELAAAVIAVVAKRQCVDFAVVGRYLGDAAPTEQVLRQAIWRLIDQKVLALSANNKLTYVLREDD